MLQAGQLLVGRARLRNASGEARPWLESTLAGVEPARIGLAPRAVLYVPRLAPAAPLRRQGGGRIGAQIEAELGRSLRQASRPGRGGEGGGPLLFDCEADFLAWLIAGWLGHLPEGRDALPALAHPRPPAIFLRGLLERGELIPALFDGLASHGALVDFVAGLSPVEADRAVAAVAAAHGLRLAPAMMGAPTPFRDGGRLPRRLEQGLRRAWLPSRVLPAVAAARRQARTIAPEAFASGLGGPARKLVVLALMLARAPSWARSQGEALWIEAPDEPAAPAGAKGTSGSPTPDDGTERTQPGVEEPRTPETPVTAEELPATPTAGSLEDVRPRASMLPQGVERIETEFGGLLFLLGLFLRLGLYADFSRPLDPGLRLSPWALLRRLGRRWFRPGFVDDALDGVLARLDGLPPGPRLPRQPRVPALGPIAARIEVELAARLAMRAPQALALLCRRPAEIVLSPGALDVVLSLDRHPIAIRAAGLDRDPGWIPAAGRAVAFEFR